MISNKDHGLEVLLHLDGDRYFIDEDGHYEVCFSVRKTGVSASKPYGIRYSLVLIDKHGDRIVGFDNAHPVPDGMGRSRKKTVTFDHKHVRDRTTPYNYQGAVGLVADFLERGRQDNSKERMIRESRGERK